MRIVGAQLIVLSALGLLPLALPCPSSHCKMANTYTEIETQLAGCSAFFASQSSVGMAPAMLESTMEAMSKTIIAMLEGLQTLDTVGAASINRAIALSSFSPDLKRVLAGAVASRLMSTYTVCSQNQSGDCEPPGYLYQC